MGGSSGGGGHTPYEAPDNLKSAQRLSAIGLISLGPIRGAVTADQYQSAFFDYTPIKNSKGEWNYQNTLIRYRLGYQDQQPLEDFDASEREVSVGAEVKLEHPISRTVIDPDIDLLRITLGVNALFSQNNQGDTHGASVQLEILINGQSRQAVTIDGKSSSRFHRSYLIDNLPPRPFTVTVRRVTPDSKSQRLQNATFWSSYTEIISTKLSYPNMAIVGIKTDSRYNPSFPNINFLLYGRLVKVPSNYDPDTRTYGSGLWRGDFKLAWTNNPAWVFYDLVTNKLAGLGQRLGDYGIDKFQLYQIAQYCDQQVPDGYGGVEPRMVANLWLTEQRDAYSVISDMASVFRAIVVWNGTQLTAIQDRTSDPVCSFTQANVIDGKFNRQYVPLKSIFTAVEVEYADERNNYQKAIEYVADDAMIKRYGYNVKKIVAFACTSRGQARRYGKWVLETSRLEQCTISFSVGREGLQVLPGDIIEIADKSYANVNLGGRVLAINGRTVTLDAPIEVQGEKHLSYLVNDNNGQRLVRRKISQINAQNKSLVTLDSEPTDLQVMDTWALHTPLVSTQRYRVLGVAENEDGSYGITALQHEPQKERIVDEGAIFTPLSETRHKVEPQLTHLGVQPTLSGDMKVSWEVTSGNSTVKYDIKVLKDGKLYLFKRNESSSELNLADLANGEYQVTIIARDAQGRMLSEKVQSFTIDNPPTPKNVSVSGGLSDITLSWDFVDEATQTEIWASETNDLANAERIAKVTANIYTHNVGPRQTRYYWLRHTRGINVGDWYQQQGLSAETGADIDAELALLNEKLSQNIIDEVFDTAMPARKLEMTKTVARIDNPTENIGHKQLYNEADGKLYIWDGNKYTAKVQAVDLEGQLASNQLEQALVNQLTQASSTANNALSKANTVQSALAQEVTQRTQAIQAETRARTTAISAEATARTQALQTEANARTQALQAEANTRGTAVSRLEQADREQAQLITTATAKADNALSGLSEERQARISGDNAESQARTALTARVANAESGISTLQNSVASTNRSVSELSQNLNAKIDGISVGGRNYAKLANYFLFWESVRNGYVVSITNKQRSGLSILRNTAISDGTPVVFSFKIQKKNGELTRIAGHSSQLIEQQIFIDGQLVGDNFAQGVDYPNDEQVHYLVIKGKYGPTADSNKGLYIQPNRPSYATTYSADIWDIKLEIGNVATDWSPAPEDIDKSIGDVSADLTLYKSTQASHQQAQSEQLSGMNSRLGGMESQITTVGQSLTTLEHSLAQQAEKVSVVGNHVDGLNQDLNQAKQELNASLVSERQARIDADNVNAEQINGLLSRVGNAESTITTIQSTKANKNEIASIAQQSLQSIWQADTRQAVDNIKVGGRNYAKLSDYFAFWDATLNGYTISVNNKLRGGISIAYNPDIKEGEDVVFSYRIKKIDGNLTTIAGHSRQLTHQQVFIDGVYVGNDYHNGVAYPNDTVEHLVVIKGKYGPTTDSNKAIYIQPNRPVYAQYYSASIRDIQLEIGTVVTSWTPAPEDVDRAISAVSAELTTHKSTQAETDRVQSEQLVAHTTRLGTAESKIQTAEQSLTTLRESTATRFNEINVNFTQTNQNVTNLNSRITTEETARADGDRANTEKITALTSRVGSAESKISVAEQSLTTLNNSMATKFSEVAANFTKVNGNLTTTNTDLNARITSEERARADGDKSNTDKITALTSRVGATESSVTSLTRTVTSHTSAYATDKRELTTRLNGAESSISTTSQAVNTLNGTVRALHTIQAVTISGGKKAIAGISMGASGSESSVIVMADKFNVVKNAQDGNVKPMFSVVNNQVAVNGDLIADGTISARMMAANSVQAGTIQAGAINANHLQAGQISADKLAIGLGGNLLYNPIFANNAYGWSEFNAKGGDWSNCPTTNAIERAYHINDYHPKGEVNECWRLITLSGTQAQFNTLADRRSWVDLCRQFVNVVADKWYIASIYVGGFHCAGNLLVEKYSSDGSSYQGVIAMTPCSGQNDIAQKPLDFIDGYSGHFQKGLGQNARRIFVKFKAPETGKILLVMRVSYYAKNQTYADFYCARPMLEECTEYTKEPSPWQNAGVTAIHGGSIVTNTITAQQMAASTITANEIASGAIATRHLSANSVNAGHVVSKSLTADKLNINSLSAISANLGAVTAGSIRGVTITGNTISGNTISGGTISGANISGTTINGGTIKGARLEGATGRFTGSLEVAELIGSNIIENVVGTLTYSHTTETTESGAKRFIGIYKKTIRIGVSSVDRYISIPGYDVDIILPKNQTRDIAIQKSSDPAPSSLSARNQTFHFLVLAYAVSSARTISF